VLLVVLGVCLFVFLAVCFIFKERVCVYLIPLYLNWTCAKLQLHLSTCKPTLFWEMYLAERVKAKLGCHHCVGNMVSVHLQHPVKRGSMSACSQ